MLNLIQIPTQKGLGLIGYWINHFYLIIIILFFLQDIDVDDFRLCLIGSTKLMKTQTSQTSLIITISFFYLINIIIICLQDIHLNYF